MLESVVGFFEVGGTLILSPVIRTWYNRWGVEPGDANRALAGDDLVPEFIMGYTRSILIDAKPEQVWPWLVQLGQGRGGMYSYDGLENLVGCNIHSANRIVPEHQNLQVGDLIRMGPHGYPCFRVAAIDPDRAMVLVGADNKTEIKVEYIAQPKQAYSMATWQFMLDPIGENQTRLFVRQRLTYTDDMRWIWRITEPIGFVMERKMLRGIKQRAERTAKD